MRYEIVSTTNGLFHIVDIKKGETVCSGDFDKCKKICDLLEIDNGIVDVDFEPYTKDEREVSDLLLRVIEKYFALPKQHPSDTTEFITAIHQIQHLIGMRILRRDYPKEFLTFGS
jgi:hypothetical protein